jgi:hypothetical protein
LNSIDANPWSPWIDVLSIRYFFSFWENMPSKYKLLRREPFFIYENPGALPRAYLVAQSVSISDVETMDYVKNHPQHDFRKSVIINSPRPEIPASDSSSVQGKVIIASYEPNVVKLEVEASSPAWVVLSDAYDEGWSAQINGHPTTVYRGNGVQRVVRVEKGLSQILYRYEPPWFLIGAFISGLSMITSIFLWFRPKEKHDRRSR